MMTRLSLMTVLAVASIASIGIREPMASELSDVERTALFESACTWSGAAGVDAAMQRCAAPSELTWSSARQGKFVQGEGEWLVSLAGPCIGGCPGVTFVARNMPDGWSKLHEDADLVTDECAVVRLADGRDHVACLGGAGPHQGYMTQWLELRGYGANSATRQLLRKENGGECTLGTAAASNEYDGDELTKLAAGNPGTGAALTVQLIVRRVACTPGDEDHDAKATIRSKHELRFVQRGADLVPDAETAELVKRHGWAPDPS